MRILLVTSMVPDPAGVGAIPKLLAAQLEGLAARHRITLVCAYGEDPGQAEAARRLLASDLDAHILDRRRSPDARRRWRVRAELAGAWLTRRQPWRVVCGAGGLQPLLDRVGAEREFDVVAVEDNPVAVLRFPAGVPKVLTEHEASRAPASAWRSPKPGQLPRRALRELDWRRWESFLPRAWRRFDLVQVFCDADAEAIAAADPGLAARVRVNPYGILPPEPPDRGRERPGTILFTGTFAHLPNREAARWLAGEIMPALRRRRPGALLRVVGIGPPPEVAELAGPGVEIVADASSIAPHLAEAALVVAPVRSGGGMRMKVLEAMALGKAVLTTPLGAEGFTGFDEPPPLAIAADADGIAAAAAELLADDDRRRELGDRARRFALRHHSPAAWAERLERVYAEAVDSARAAAPVEVRR